MKTIRLKEGKERSLLRRHPWIFDSAIAKGGADPMVTIERWLSRVRHVHLKDLSPKWAEMQAAGVELRSPEGYCELGEGGIDFAPLWPMLEQINYSGWLMA